jgi:hypothetical protein
MRARDVGDLQNGAVLRLSHQGFASPLAALLVLGLLAAPASPKQGNYDDLDEIETVDLTPDDRPSFTIRNVGAGVGALFRGTKHYYEKHAIKVETTPASAFLDLFYVRSNFQKSFEQAESPVHVLLPKRSETTAKDSITIRAFAEGYRQKSVTLPADTTQKRVVIDLDPLPNTLEALSHQYFAGRSSLTFLTEEQLTFRVQEAEDGISVILTETAQSRDATATLETARSPIVDEMVGQQLGEDLLVQITYSDEAIANRIEVRSRESYDAARDLHAFTVDLLPRNGRAEAIAKARDALAKLSESDVTGCAENFDTILRSQLDPGALSRALTPSGSFTDPYLRAAMRRLGEVSPNGVVSFTGGLALNPAVSIELEAALSQAAGAEGYLVLLRQFVAEFEAEEFRRETLRSLIAPELDLGRFVQVVEAAEQGERVCLASL